MKVVNLNAHAKKPSFIYYLHEENLFLEKKLYSFLDDIIKHQVEIHSDKKVIRCIVESLLYSIKSFTWHFDQRDQSKITNINDIIDIYPCYMELFSDFIIFLSTGKKIPEELIKCIQRKDITFYY